MHREDIINRRGAFWRLRERDRREAFDLDLLGFLQRREYTVVAVVIDKKAHIERYGKAAFHPYHFCLAAILERYCGFLNFYNARGDVMSESRGGREDRQLKAAYEHVIQSGTQWRHPDFFQGVLTSKHLKLKPKPANVAGLQLADLLAHPCKQEILLEHARIQRSGDVFGVEVCKSIASKYNLEVYQGRVEGYGEVFLIK